LPARSRRRLPDGSWAERQVACCKGPSPSRIDHAALPSAHGRRRSLRLGWLQLEVRLRLPLEHETWLPGLRGPVADRSRVFRRVLRRDVASTRASPLALARADSSTAAAAAAGTPTTCGLATTTLPPAAAAPPAAKPAPAPADTAVASAAAAPAAPTLAALTATVATEAPMARQGRE